ncbi:MAG: hypothetical protein LBB50_06155 [Oscillospiraceae bacterium]|nr:hypothetical protein [Oscillospiraceae bacterium]
MGTMESVKKFGKGVMNTARVVAGQQIKKPHAQSQPGKPVHVFVSGILGTGEYSSFEHILPYWGLTHGDILQEAEHHGYECYAASCGPFSSAWDRACELFAQLTGGVVDYGEAHSRQYGHKRYGRVYPALFEGWSTEKPVHLLGHSFGGATVRLFALLCAEGSEEERVVTPPGELSPLFGGGMRGRVLTVTCLASPHNGTTAICTIQKDQPLWPFYPVYTLLLLCGTTPVANSLYDVHLEQFGLSNPAGKFFGHVYNPVRMKKFLESRDHATADLSLDGAAALNRRTPLRPELYYFSYPCVATHNAMGDRKLPSFKEFKNPLLGFYGAQMGMGFGFAQVKKSLDDGNEILDPMWLQNDMAVPLASSMYPLEQAHRDRAYGEEAPPAPGVWNVMPTKYDVDHGYYCGWDPNNTNMDELVAFYLRHFRLLEQAVAQKTEAAAA